MKRNKMARSHVVACPICGERFTTWTGQCSAIYDKPDCKRVASRRRRKGRRAEQIERYISLSGQEAFNLYSESITEGGQ